MKLGSVPVLLGLLALGACANSQASPPAAGGLSADARLNIAAAAQASGDSTTALTLLAGAAQSAPQRADVQQRIHPGAGSFGLTS